MRNANTPIVTTTVDPVQVTGDVIDTIAADTGNTLGLVEVCDAFDLDLGKHLP